MKKLLFILILLTLSALSIVAQSPCPTISITAPTEQIKIGESMTFSARVDGINTENLKYQWTVSNGRISSGQGTLAVAVATTDDMAGQQSLQQLKLAECRKIAQIVFLLRARLKQKWLFAHL